MRQKLLLVNVTDYRYPPISFAYVMDTLKVANIDYDFIELHKNNIQLLHKMLIKGNYFAAATGSLIGGYADLEVIFNVIKKRLPEIPTILGGRIAAICPSHLLEKLKVDYLVIGDANPTFAELLQFLTAQNEISVNSIEGIAFRKKGSFLYTKKRKQQDLQKFFPCWDDVDLSQYIYPYQYPVITCIGCVGKCTFCAPGVTGIRLRPVKNVIDEINWAMRKFGIDRFEIISETFYPSTKSIMEFCRNLKKLSTKLRWRCNLRADIPREVFSHMAEAGCQEIIIGIESYDNIVLQKMNKMVSEEMIHTTINEVNACGMRVSSGLIAGNLSDTPTTLKKTTDLVVDNNIMVDRPYFFTPLQIYPGTKLYAEARQKGLIFNEYKNIKDVSESLYSYLNPLQKRLFLPKGFINITCMPNNQLEFTIESNEWRMQQNAFKNWKLKHYDGYGGYCCYCNENFTVNKYLQTRENAVVCPNCLAYNLITMDQTSHFKEYLCEVLHLFKGDGKFAVIGTRESAYWLTSFINDNDMIRDNWFFFRHYFLNPNSNYLCGREVHDIKKLCSLEFDYLILCDIMHPKYYVNLIATCKKRSPSIHWLLPYDCYDNEYDYIPRYACEDELRHVAQDLAKYIKKTFCRINKIAVIQNTNVGSIIVDELIGMGFHIINKLDSTKFNFINNKQTRQHMRFMSQYADNNVIILVIDNNPKRQYKIASFYRSETKKDIFKIITLNEFLFTQYTLHENYNGTRIY